MSRIGQGLAERVGLALVMAAVAAILAAGGLTARLDNRLLDIASRAWTPPLTNDIALIVIDEASLAELGRFPWSRQLHAQLIDRLRRDGVRAVAFDMIFAEPDSHDPFGDEAFAAAIDAFGKVVLPVFTGPASPDGPVRVVSPFDLLTQVGARLAHVQIPIDDDGIFRRIARTAELEGIGYPVLAQALLDAGSDAAAPVAGTTSEILVPMSERSSFLTVTFADVVRGRLAPGLLEGRLAIVGVTASGLASGFATPITAGGAPMPGVLLHAHVLQALARGILWHQMDAALRVPLLALLVMPLVLAFGRIWRDATLALAAIGVLLATSALMLSQAGIWLAPTPTIVALLLALVAWSIAAWRKEWLRVAAERARAAVTLRAIADSVIGIGPDGRVDYVNPAGEALTGWTSEAMRRRPLAEALPLVTDKGALDLAAAGEATRATLRSRAGELRHLVVSQGQILDDNAAPAGHVIVLRDITAQVQAEQQLKRSEAQRHELERELQLAGRLSVMGQVSAAIAHELNQPLAALSSYASATQKLIARADGSALERISAIVPKIGQQAERAGLVIRRLRRLFERGPEEPGEKDSHDPCEVIKDAVLLGMIGAEQDGIELRLSLPADLPRLPMDRIQIQQVIVNLVRNAVQAMQSAERRRLEISAWRREGDLVVSVADTGSGIAEEVMSSLFEPFQTTKPDGMGLGLSISRSIVERHGGVLDAAPHEGGGTVFSFNLPLRCEVDA